MWNLDSLGFLAIDSCTFFVQLTMWKGIFDGEWVKSPTMDGGHGKKNADKGYFFNLVGDGNFNGFC